MTIETLFDAWQASGAFASIEANATEAEIQTAEQKIGATLPRPLREIYSLFNGRWVWELDFYPLNFPPEHSSVALANANEKLNEYGWYIPEEIRLFAGDGGGGTFGIWLSETGHPIFSHPIIEVGELFEEGCMGIAGTNLLSFLHGWSAYRLMLEESNELRIVELGEDKDAPNRLQRIQTALDMLQVPQSLRGDNFDDEIAPFRKWADPQLPDPYGDSYSQGYTISDLKRIFGAT